MSAAALTAVIGFPGAAAAHTESDLVAVAAGDHATLTLKPTHGCEGSPTVEVAIQAPVVGATAVDVDGWTATSTDDAAAGTTVLEWTGGSLPADAEGAFPVEFTVPDTVGELLLFPAVQVCENGQEMAWIDGDPEGETPAPRILVLEAGSPSAATIDDVPADAPGRDQLTAIVDVDNPSVDDQPEETTTTAPEPSDEDEATTTSAAEADEAADDAAANLSIDDEASDEDDDSSRGLIVAVVAVMALIGVAAGFVLSRRKGAGQAS
ncbi:MAG: DUF1775 domain-containing protein [Acidimicrobiales bacterium]|nr:DUF1775 domain-containing protein [Acidimicrobiales bacterium]